MILLLLPLLLPAAQAQPIVFPYQRYQVVEGGRAGFRGESTLHEFGGEVKTLRATLHADLARLAQTAGGEVRFRVADLSTDDDDRDENMRADLEAERFPEIVFRLDRLDGGLSPDGGATLSAAGSFAIHGVERSRVFPVTIRSGAGGRLAIQGTLRFLQTDHGITPHSTFGLVKVHDEVEVWFDLELAPLASQVRDGACRAIQCEQLIRIPGADPQAASIVWRAWGADNALLLEAGEEWLLAAERETLRVEPRAGARMDAAPDADQDFVAARERLAALESRLGSLSAEQRARAGVKLEEAIARLRETLATAPAPGAAELRENADVLEIVLGGRVWARLEGMSGDARVPAALAALPNLPASVRLVLRDLRGTPTRAMLLTASSAGSRELRMEFGPSLPCAVPSWVMDPKQWVDPFAP